MEAPVPDSLEGIERLLPAYERYFGPDATPGDMGGMLERLGRIWSEEHDRGWNLASLTLYASEQLAEESVDSDCARMREPHQEAGSAPDRYCASPVEELRNDPEGLYLPTGRYRSSVVIQRGRLVVSVLEVRDGGDDPIRKGETIREIAAALQELARRERDAEP